MSDGSMCRTARKRLGLTQEIWSQFAGIDRSVISKIENNKANAEGVIVPFAGTIFKLTSEGESKIDPKHIADQLLAIPEDRRGPWTGYNVLVSICIDHNRREVLDEVAGLRFKINETEGRSKNMPKSMRHNVEDFMDLLNDWRTKASPEAQRFIENALASESQTLTWIKMALEADKKEKPSD